MQCKSKITWYQSNKASKATDQTRRQKKILPCLVNLSKDTNQPKAMDSKYVSLDVVWALQ